VRPEFFKRDPERYPVRFLAGIWEQRTGTRLTPKQLGQLRDLRTALGELTRDVIDWMTEPVHWWRFGQQVRAESGLQSAPPSPHVGFLLMHRGRALKVMRVELHHSTSAAHRRFCARLDELRCEQWRHLLLVYSADRPEWISKIAAAHTTTDLQRLFIEIVDENTARFDIGSIVEQSPL
jgi:hypothetical protein